MTSATDLILAGITVLAVVTVGWAFARIDASVWQIIFVCSLAATYLLLLFFGGGGGRGGGNNNLPAGTNN